MQKPIVTKEFQFDAAHMLTGHEGLCKNLHGHTYKVEVGITGLMGMHGPAEGMIMDFKALKECCNEALFDKLDHAYIYNSEVEDDGEADLLEVEIAEILSQYGRRVYDMRMRPTAENMSRQFFTILYNVIRLASNGYTSLVYVRVYETPTSYAEVHV